MHTHGDDSAYPLKNVQQGDAEGLTKREEFAKSAMQGLLANKHVGQEQGSKSIAQLAVDEADALIAALNETGGKK